MVSLFDHLSTQGTEYVSRLFIQRVTRVREDGTFWETVFAPGLNVLIGPQNTSKTTTLRIIDFCMGDERNAKDKFGRSIADEYSEFRLELAANGNEHVLIRRLKKAGQIRQVEIDGQLASASEFSQWALDELGWPELSIPKGLDNSVTEEVALSFRSVYRHIYRRADSWTEFAYREHEHYRRAVTALLLGLAEPIYSRRTLEVLIARTSNELAHLEGRRRELRETIDDAVRRVVDRRLEFGSVDLASIGVAVGSIATQIEDLEQAREALRMRTRAHPGYDNDLDQQLAGLNHEIAEAIQSIGIFAAVLLEQGRLIQTLEADKKRIQRAMVATDLFDSILVSTCPACHQSVERRGFDQSSVYGSCYVCRQVLKPDVKQRRLELELLTVEQEQAELREVVGNTERQLDELRALRLQREADRHQLLDRIERERRAFVTPLLREFEQVQFRLGQLEQQRGALERLGGMQGQVASLDAHRLALTSQVEDLRQAAIVHHEKSGILVERTNMFAEVMSSFLRGLPSVSQRWGLISVDPQTFTFFVGRELWQNALGEERKVLFLLAYQYAYLYLSAREEMPYPGLAILDNPFQQDAPEDQVEDALSALAKLCGEDPSLQVIVTTRRSVKGILGRRIRFDRVFNPVDVVSA